MDSFHIQNVEVAKPKIPKRHYKFNNFMRILELSLALFMFSCFFTWIPFGFKIFSDYIRQFVSIFHSTLCVFVLSNIIIFTMALNFKTFLGSNAAPDLYQEFITKSDCVQRVRRSGDDSSVLEVVAKEQPREEEFQDKQIVCYSKNKNADTNKNDVDVEPMIKVADVHENMYRRKQTDIEKKSCCGVLRKSEIDLCRAMVVAKGRPEKKAVDEMSSEEFRLKIEAFIAEHKWYQKQELSAETMAIMVG